MPRPPTFPAPADQPAAARLIEDFIAIGSREARFARTPAGQAALAALGGNAPHLAGLALREPDILIATSRTDPQATLQRIIAELQRVKPNAPRRDIARALRRAKRRAGLAIALADLAGLWSLETVTRALSDLADAGVAVALRHLLRGLHDRGTIILPDPKSPETGCHFAVLGMGKLGARELNYSSDIDLVLLFDPTAPVYRADTQSATGRGDAQNTTTAREDSHSVMARLARDFVQLLAARDEDGMMFRVDLRLRPDPAATPPVISLAAALAYYESHGRTWERAAFSKARPVAGDLAFGTAFLEQIRPFVWRRNLDFAAITEIHDMKRRIDQRHDDAPGALLGRDVKLGRGGIREIEFIVQTLELVWGGHEPALRIAPTLMALRALAAAKHLPRHVARDLAASYRTLRGIEHRLQMVADRQTHALPASEPAFAAFATFMGEAGPHSFATRLDRLFERVHRHFAAFFDADAGDAPGLDRGFDPGEAGRAPAAFRADAQSMGFADPQHLAERLRAWRGGTLPALRAARARGLLDAILPALLAALSRQPDPDLAFRRFDRMLERQRAGIPLLSLFRRNTALLDRLATVLGAAAALSEHLAVHPGALDALLAPVARFTRPGAALRRLLHDAGDLEQAVTILRRFVRREEFHLAVATLERRIDVDQAGVWRSDLAQAAMAALLPRVIADFARRYGRLRGGRFAVVALGRAGAREMQPGSDLDLMLIYDHPPDRAPANSTPRLPASQYFGRLAQSLIGAITAPGAEGPIYPVDMRLRPSGNKGPVAVSLAAFRRYHAEQAWTWERLALTRARVIAATPGFATTIETAIGDAVSRPVDPATIRADTVAMRRRLAEEAPASGRFDLKSRAGGMMELGFVVEALQLIHGPAHHTVLRPRTRDALEALAAAQAIAPAEAAALIRADHWFRAVQAMRRITGLAAPEPESAPASLAPILAAAAAADFAALVAGLEQQAAIVRAAFVRHLGNPFPPPGDHPMDLDQGDKAPAFSLPATGGRTVSLAGFEGRPFVLYFYPKADTPGCTKEACAFQEALPQLGHIGIEVVGVSKDKMPALEKFAAKYDLKFPLAADPEGRTVEAFGAWVEKSMYGKSYMGIDRATFLIDETGTIAQVWRKVKVPGHAKAVMDAAAKLA